MIRTQKLSFREVAFSKADACERVGQKSLKNNFDFCIAFSPIYAIVYLFRLWRASPSREKVASLASRHEQLKRSCRFFVCTLPSVTPVYARSLARPVGNIGPLPLDSQFTAIPFPLLNFPTTKSRACHTMEIEAPHDTPS